MLKHLAVVAYVIAFAYAADTDSLVLLQMNALSKPQGPSWDKLDAALKPHKDDLSKADSVEVEEAFLEDVSAHVLGACDSTEDTVAPKGAAGRSARVHDAKEAGDTDCTAYMTNVGCGWTSRFNCPGQTAGTQGSARQNAGDGYQCCCNQGLWQESSMLQTDARCSDKVLAAADNYCAKHHWMMVVGGEKGTHLETALSDRVAATENSRGLNVFEIGTYVGYSTLRLARQLPSDGTLYTVDISPERQKIAEEFVNLAKPLAPKVVFLAMDADKAMHTLKAKGVRLDFVYVDHMKSDYGHALKSLVSMDLLSPGATIVADNTERKRCEMQENCDYLDYVQHSGLFNSRTIESQLGGGSDLRDAMEVSIFKDQMA